MTSLAHAAEILLPAGSDERARAIARALEVETATAPPRTRVQVEARRDALRLVVEGEDLRSLRAGVNSYLRWADTAIEVARRVGRGNP